VRNYLPYITLNKNSRGVYCLDPTMGCENGLQNDKNGCYFNCYAAITARARGFNFTKTIKRQFRNKKHLNKICSHILARNMLFIRMGCSGDPSNNWDHTMNICNDIYEHIKYNQLNLFEINNKPIFYGLSSISPK
jgi:hypothetical protein